MNCGAEPPSRPVPPLGAAAVYGTTATTSASKPDPDIGVSVYRVPTGLSRPCDTTTGTGPVTG